MKDRFGIVEDGFVAEAQDLEASLLEVDVPVLIPGLLRIGVGAAMARMVPRTSES